MRCARTASRTGGDAVGIVYDQIRDLNLGEAAQHAFLAERLGVGEDHPGLAVFNGEPHPITFSPRLPAAKHDRGQVRRFGTAKLVGHEREERVDDNGHSWEDGGGQLETERLAGTRW